MSDENSQGTVFGNFLRLGLNLVIDGRAKLLNDPVSAESATRINEVKEFVESLENLWLLPAAKISAEEPRRIRAGKYSIRTSMSDVNINVVHANKGYLLGAREIPFSTQGQSIFGVPAEDTVLTTVANAKDACTRYDNDLKEKKGLENAHDRTYLLYKFIFNKTEHMAKIIACLRHDTERLDRYANNNTIIRYVFKNIPESDRDNWLITAEKMRIFENNYSILLPQEDLSATVTEAVKSRLREKVTKLVTDGMGLIRRNASLDAFNAASQGYGRRILEQMFAGSVEVNDASLATALMDQVNPVPRDQPFAILKGLYNHGFERVGCVVSAEKFKADTDAQQQYMGDSLFAFAMFKQALSQRDSEKLDPKKAIIVRPEFFWDGEDFKVSKLALNDSYNRTILSKTICNGKLTPAEE